MSGGSHNYVCYRISDDLCGQMYDAELNDMMDDIAKLAHDLEWADSGDSSMEDYQKRVAEFKQKWFKSNRETRLKGYVDKALAKYKKEMYSLIGAKDNE